MKKNVWLSTLIGMIAGIAAQSTGSLLISWALKLGYWLPYPEILPETVGGEMNAALLTQVVCALAGAGIGLAIGIIRNPGFVKRNIRIKAIFSVVLTFSPVVWLALRSLNRVF